MSPRIFRLCLIGALGCGGGSPTQLQIDAEAGDLSSPDAVGPGYALSFDGVRTYATAGNAGFPAVSESLSVELWVSFPAADGTQDFLAFRSDFSSGVQIGFHAGVLAVWRVYVDRVLVQAPTNPSASTWHHVAYVRDLGTNLLYVDGALVATSTNASDNHTPRSAWLGTIDGSSNMFKGRLDDVRIWSVSRSADEVVMDMQGRSPPPESGLIAWWSFDDDASGGRSLDLSGSGNHVTLGDGVARYMPARVPADRPLP